MRQYRVEMGGFEPWCIADYGDLNASHSSWTQPPGHWLLFFLEHGGVLSINNKPIPYSKGNVALVAPGTKAAFAKVGEDTFHYSMTFALTKRTETVIIPAVADLGDLTEVRRQEFIDSMQWIRTSIMRSLACAYNILWSIAQPLQAFRKSDLVFDAEALIIKRLSNKINIREMADELAISHAHLLRLFREEHGCTIQEYVREKRVEIAGQMITTTDLALKDIANRTGMPDLQYFNKVIRASTGLSPRALREQALTRTQH